MSSDNDRIEQSNAHPAEICHPLAEKDGEAVAAIWTELTSSKSNLSGPDASGYFNETIDKILAILPAWVLKTGFISCHQKRSICSITCIARTL